MDNQHPRSDSDAAGWTVSSFEECDEENIETIRALDHAFHFIQNLGPAAMQTVAAGGTTQFGEWLGWPAWLKQSTPLSGDFQLPDQITLSDDLIIIANIVDHAKGPDILVRLTEDFRIPGAPITVPALYNAPTLLDALNFFVRTAVFGSPFLKVDFRQDRDQFSICIDSDIPKGKLRDFCVSAMLAVAHRFVDFFVVDELEDLEIDLEMTKSDALARPLTNLRGKCHFDAGCYALHGKIRWLQIENLRTDKAFWNFALERMTMAEREGCKSDIVRTIRASVCRTMESEQRVPRLKQIAASEGISERTLIRTLASQGIRFHQIVEEERRIKVAELIGNSSISLTEIARQLGFTDMSSFGRSYRQWFGITPGQARSRRGD